MSFVIVEVSHSRRDWSEKKVWKAVWRQGTSNNDDSFNQDTSNVWNQQQPRFRSNVWNRDDSVSGGDWNNNNFGGGWNNNNNNNFGNTWDTNSFVSRWNLKTLRRSWNTNSNFGGGWNSNNPGGDWNNNNFGGSWSGNVGNRWGSVAGRGSWNNGDELNEQVVPVQPSSFRKEFRRVETVKIQQQSKSPFRIN